MSLGSLLNRQPVIADPQASLAQAARLMREKNVGAIVVVEQNRPVGILTDRDLAMAVCLHAASPDEPIKNRMSSPVQTLRTDDGIYTATERMKDLAVRRLPVVNHAGVLVGMATLDDLLSLVSRELRNMAEGVRAEVAAVD